MAIKGPKSPRKFVIRPWTGKTQPSLQSLTFLPACGQAGVLCFQEVRSTVRHLAGGRRKGQGSGRIPIPMQALRRVSCEQKGPGALQEHQQLWGDRSSECPRPQSRAAWQGPSEDFAAAGPGNSRMDWMKLARTSFHTQASQCPGRAASLLEKGKSWYPEGGRAK